MFKIERTISLTVAGNVYTGTLKVVEEKWCFVNENGHYFKVFYTDKTRKISLIGDMLHTIPLNKISLQLQHIIQTIK